MTDRLDRYKAIIHSNRPEAVIAFVMYLSRLRSSVIIGRALADKFPTEQAWQEALCSQEFLELVDEVVQFAVDVTGTLELVGGIEDVDRIQAAVEEEYPRALAAVQELAARLGVPGEDLLSVLMEA